MDKTCILRGHSNFDLYLQNLISLSLSSSGHLCQFEEIPSIFFWDFTFKRLGCHEVTVILTSHHQNWISSSLSRSERLRQIWRNSVKSFLKYHRPPESHSYRWLGGTRSLYQRHTELETWADDGNSSGVRHLFSFSSLLRLANAHGLGSQHGSGTDIEADDNVTVVMLSYFLTLVSLSDLKQTAWCSFGCERVLQKCYFQQW